MGNEGAPVDDVAESRLIADAEQRELQSANGQAYLEDIGMGELGTTVLAVEHDGRIEEATLAVALGGGCKEFRSFADITAATLGKEALAKVVQNYATEKAVNRPDPDTETKAEPTEKGRKKNEDTSEVEVVAETVEVRRSVGVKDDFVEAVVDVAAQLEVRVSETASSEAAARLARERVGAVLAQQELLIEAVVREQFMIEEMEATAVVLEQETEIIQLAPRIVEVSESVVVDDVESEVSTVEVVEIAEPVASQNSEYAAEIINLDDFRTLSELTEAAATFEADETPSLMADEEDIKLAEIIYPEAWWGEPEAELEPLTVADFAQELRELAVAPESDVEVESDLRFEVTPEMIAVNEQVAAALEALVAPEKIAEVQDLLDKIMEAVQSFAAISKIEAEAAKVDIKLLCKNLFESLGIEYNEEMIEQFAQSLLLIQAKRLATVRTKRQQEIVDQGTRERDRHLQASFTQQTLYDDTQPERLGYVALMVS
jgi:hypothetical protein